MRVCTQAYTHTHTNTHRNTHTHTHTQSHTQKHAHTETHTGTHTQKHIHTQMHMHKHPTGPSSAGSALPPSPLPLSTPALPQQHAQPPPERNHFTLTPPTPTSSSTRHSHKRLAQPAFGTAAVSAVTNCKGGSVGATPTTLTSPFFKCQRGSIKGK
jgi:hypothetical protein